MLTVPPLAYRGCEFIAAVADLAPHLRHQAVETIEPKDFTPKPYRIIFTALTTMPNFNTISGRENTLLALRDHLVATGALTGDLSNAIETALQDIASNRAFGAQAFTIAPKLKEDSFRAAAKKFSQKLGHASDTEPKENIDALIRNSLDELRRLSARCSHTNERSHLKAVV